ncbi:MAG TPA: flavin reductase family protein [Kineosporiaceae bacterium]|nr:flavin reductase family protein [Kineosporiaceae bacterium]
MRWREAAVRQDEVKPIRLPEAGPDELRRIFRRQAATVAVVTTSHHGLPVGLLVTSLASVSASPPLVSFNVARTSSSWPALEVAEHLGVHVLAAEQEELATRFARTGVDRFGAPTSWTPGPHGIPLIQGTAAWAVAVVEERFEVGDHVIVVARLRHAGASDDVGPLLHHDGEYRQVSAPQIGSEGQQSGSWLTVIRGDSGPDDFRARLSALIPSHRQEPL